MRDTLGANNVGIKRALILVLPCACMHATAWSWSFCNYQFVWGGFGLITRTMLGEKDKEPFLCTQFVGDF